MDPDVVEIPPPIHHPSKLIKKKAILCDVIDIDNDEDSDDLVLIGEKFGEGNKRKKIEAVHNGYGDHQDMEVSVNIPCPSGVEQFGPASGIKSSNGYVSVSHNVNVDVHSSDLSFEDDDYGALFSEDFMDVDTYSIWQAHFDHMDIPAGIEASIPWMSNFNTGSKNSEGGSLYPWCPTLSDAKNSHATMKSQPSWPTEPPHPIQGTSVGSSSMLTKTDATDQSFGVELSSPQLFIQSAPGKKESTASQHGGGMLNLNLSLGVDSSKDKWFKSHLLKKPAASTESNNNGFLLEASESIKLPLPPGIEPPYWRKFKNAKKAQAKDVLFHSKFLNPVEGLNHVPGIESANSMWKNSPNYNPSFINHSAHSDFYYPYDPLHANPEQIYGNIWVHNYAGDGKHESTADIPVVTISDEDRDGILRKFQQFKQFDTVEDTSDHYYIRNSYSLKQHSKNWSKRIQEEWKILEKDLPDSIFVRVYESRMDLLRAVIIGAEGTPYHDGLFFFDVFFPSGYPNVPPDVHYHSGGVRLNPNLYNCGKVCLSLLNTWSGNKNEKWLPGVSTVLQVLVSIQGLILNTKPFFNEPGYSRMSGSAVGEMRSLRYNEDTFILSLKTMTYIMRKPPKHFEDFIAGHFCSRAHDILVACKAYMDGAQVGCLVKGGVQDVDEGDGSCSQQFKETLAGFLNKLVREFSRVGAKDCDKFLPPATTVNKPSSSMSQAASASATA